MPKMKDRALSLRAIFLLLFLTPFTSYAQTSAPRPRSELGAFGELPLASAQWKGVTSDRHFFLFGFSYSYLLTHRRVCDVRWVSEIMPVELLAEPFIKGTNIQTLRSVAPFTETKTTYGLGTNPVGADVIFLPERRWQPFTGVHAGASYFTRNVLGFRAAQFNFMLDGRAGVRFRLHGGKSLRGLYVPAHVKRLHGAGEPRRGFAYGACSICIFVSLPAGEIDISQHLGSRFIKIWGDLWHFCLGLVSADYVVSWKGIHPSPTFISSVDALHHPFGPVLES